MNMKWSFRLASLVAAGVLACTGVARADLVIQEYDFDTDLEGWTQTGSTSLVPFSQTLASSGETVAQGRMPTASPFDPQLLPNAGTLTLSPGQTWTTVEFRVRHLNNNTGAPGGPRPYDFTSTLLALTLPNDGGFKNFGNFNTANWTQTTQPNGWSVFSYDVATYLTVDNSFDPAAEISSIRFDPVGGPPNAGIWVEVDYFRINAIPEPSVLGLLGLGGVLVWLRRRVAHG